MLENDDIDNGKHFLYLNETKYGKLYNHFYSHIFINTTISINMAKLLIKIPLTGCWNYH